jgi:hypothetical protein
MTVSKYRKQIESYVWKRRHAKDMLDRMRKGLFVDTDKTEQELLMTIEFCDVAIMELRTERRKKHDARSASRRRARLSALKKHAVYEDDGGKTAQKGVQPALRKTAKGKAVRGRKNLAGPAEKNHEEGKRTQDKAAGGLVLRKELDAFVLKAGYGKPLRKLRKASSSEGQQSQQPAA